MIKWFSKRKLKFVRRSTEAILFLQRTIKDNRNNLNISPMCLKEMLTISGVALWLATVANFEYKQKNQNR